MDLERSRYVVVEGPIGAGKTSLARVLAQHAGGEELFERPEDNPFLERFYGDMQRLQSVWSRSPQALHPRDDPFASRRSRAIATTRSRIDPRSAAAGPCWSERSR